MAFIILNDYIDIISEAKLNQILEVSRDTSGDVEVREKAEAKAITRAKEYLRSRYRVERIFKDFIPFSLSTEYTYGDRINFTYDAWVNNVYTNGQRIVYNDIVYQKNSTTSGYTAATLPTNATFFTEIADAGIYYIANPADYDNDKVYVEDDLCFYSHEIYKRNDQVSTDSGLLPTDTVYWTRVKTTEYLTELTVTGLEPSDDAWTYGDNRNQGIVECICHMVVNKLHSVINPQNIPALSRDNYSKSIDYLKELQKGVVEGDLPDIEDDNQTGFSIKFSSNPSTTHSY